MDRSLLQRRIAPILALALAAMACGINVDLGVQQPAARDNVATMVAGTLSALTAQSTLTAPSATPSPSPTPVLFNTLSIVTLSVSVGTDCRLGPRDNYGFVTIIRPGTTVRVVGKDEADNFWIIEPPGQPGTVCWLSGQYAQVTGEAAGLPSPATPVPSIYNLSEPRNLDLTCTSDADDDDDEDWSDWDTQLTWTNSDPDQTGIRIYRDGRWIATLGPRAHSFDDSFRHRGHQGVIYGVQAFSWNAVSSIVSISIRHCD